MNKTIQITKAAVVSIPFSKGHPILFKDAAIRGFKVKVGKTRKTFILEKRIHGEKRSARIFVLGLFPTISVRDARRMAQEYSTCCERGIDPLEAKLEKNGMEYREVTLLEMLVKYFEVSDSKNERREMSRFKFHMNHWFDKDMRTITVEELVELHRKIAKNQPASADRLLKMFSAVWNRTAFLIRFNNERLLPANPVPEVKKTIGPNWKAKPKNTPVIPKHQIGEWLYKVRQLCGSAPLGQKRNYEILLLSIFCGFRNTECRMLQWGNVDLKVGTIRIGREDTKTNHEYFTPLSSYAWDLLKELHKERGVNPYVFPSPLIPNRPVVNKDVVSLKIVEVIGFHFSPHATRRTFLSIGNHLCIPLITLKRLVNHRYEGGVTGGYISPAFDPTANRKEFQKIGDFIMKMYDEYVQNLGEVGLRQKGSEIQESGDDASI